MLTPRRRARDAGSRRRGDRRRRRADQGDRRRAAAVHDRLRAGGSRRCSARSARSLAGARRRLSRRSARHGVNVVAALNRDAAFVSTDSFANEIAHLFGKPGVFPVDHDLLKAALVLIVAAPAVAHVARLRLGRRLGLEPARDLGDEHVAARLVHPLAAAARRRLARPAPAGRDARACRGCSSSTRSRRCWCR